MFDDDLIRRAEALIVACRAGDLRVATAESCTGGLLAALMTEIPGSSAVLDRGFVTYSNEAKHDMLGVPEMTLARHGAVSTETAHEMATGALAHSRASLAVSITGIAGPGGETPTKPVGLVHFGIAVRGGASRAVERRFGDLGRSRVRRLALDQALALLESSVDDTLTLDHARP